MLRNYFTIAIRTLLQRKLYVAINIIGLGFALACCIFAYLNYDYRDSFDNHNSNTQNIYRLNSVREVEGDIQHWAVTPYALAEMVTRDFAGAEQFARLFTLGSVIKQNDLVFNEKLHFVDKNVFEFFNLPLKYGNIDDLNTSHAIFLSEAYALKYFGTQDPIGQQLIIIDGNGQEELCIVKGVLERVPLNSSFQMDIVISFEHLFTSGRLTPNDLANQNLITTFVEFSPNTNLQNQQGLFEPYITLFNQSYLHWNFKGFYFQPFHDIAKSSDVDMAGFVHGTQLTSNPRGVLVIVPAVMASLILLITCFNFTNISIAFANNRLKEIGIRKVLGGGRKQLIVQFLTENTILCFIASFLALYFVGMILSTFNASTDLALEISFSNLNLWIFLLLLPILTAVISGLYPAVYLSAFQPVKILKGRASFGKSNRFTKILLTSQFSISCLALIVGIILTQNAYFQDEVDFGYAIDEVAVVELKDSKSYMALSNLVGQHSKIAGVGGAVHQIGDDSYQGRVSIGDQEMVAQIAEVGGKDYLKTMGVRLSNGRHFHYGKGPDMEASVMVNQTLVNAFGLDDPIGQLLKLDHKYYTIVGVVEDYKEFGLHGLVPPCILRLAGADDFRYLVVRAKQGELSQVYDYLRSGWQQLLPYEPFQGYLQTEVVDKERYLNEGFKLVAFFLACVTILLSASGLFALVSLNIIKRTKEIGLRKMLGASELQLISLINKDFIYILFASFCIGSLLGYLLVDKLIFKFILVYHPPIGIGPFIATLLILLLSCGLTIGMKVYKVATANPINSLRTE